MAFQDPLSNWGKIYEILSINNHFLVTPNVRQPGRNTSSDTASLEWGVGAALQLAGSPSRAEPAL